MKKPAVINLSAADARRRQGFLASQHDKNGNPIRLQVLDRQPSPPVGAPRPE